MKIKKPRKLKDKQNRKYICGICGEITDYYEAVEDEGSETGVICYNCYCLQHPEFEEFGEE